VLACVAGVAAVFCRNPEVVVIDVRSYTGWLLSGDKITGAVRENYRDFDIWSAKYPKDKTLVLYGA
jgi:rhodanese-related sulfurtransferase